MKKIIAALAVLLVASCTSVAVKDFEYCGDEGYLGAACYHLFSSDSRHIAKPDWDTERVGQVCISSQALGDLKAELEELCSVSSCTTDQVQVMNRFFSNAIAR